jgi:PAS domain S-box-containing protein
MNPNPTANSATVLRRGAEERLQTRERNPQSAIRNPQSLHRLVHELRVHQIELEMQNEELQQARARGQALLVQYTDLYDSAPAGYLALDREGAIQQVNRTGALLLGVECSRLLKRRFGLFVAEGDRRAFSDFLQRVFASQTKECCEATLPQAGHHPLFVRIKGTRSADGQQCLAVVVDLTERKRTEEALRASEEQFRAMFEMASIGIAQADPRTGQMLRVNAKMCDITGYSAGELLQRRIADLTHAEDRQREWEAFQRVVRGEQRDCCLEKRCLRKDGSLAWVNVNMTVLRNAAGQPTRTMATIEDVTERKLAELRIAAFSNLGQSLSAAKSPAEAAQAIFASADQFWQWDSGALDLEVPGSRQIETALAYDLVDGQRRGVLLANPMGPPSAMNRRVMAQGAELILRQPDERPATDTIRFGDTSRLSASLMWAPVRVENRAVGVLAIQSYTANAYTREDLRTLQALADHCGGALDRLRMEGLLRTSEVRYRRLFEAAKDGILILDAEAGTVVDVNPFLVQLLGISREAILRKEIWELGFFKEIVANYDHFKELQEKEYLRYDDKPLKTADGRRIDVEFVSNVCQVDHHAVIQCNIRDISERKRTEWMGQIYRDQLRALSARIETMREEERTRLSREIHDELGQMLTGIKMDLRWMEHRLDEFGEDRRVNPILDKLVATTELVDATVKNVQRMAAELRPGMLDNLGLPLTLQYEAARFEERTGIACRLVVPGEELPLRPEATTAFFRIFQEALTNVARHAKATAVEAELQPEADGCRLEIRDNGQGMAGIDLTHPKSLGLLGMQERASLLGGGVSFTPRPGGGTVVTVRIPNCPTKERGV